MTLFQGCQQGRSPLRRGNIDPYKHMYLGTCSACACNSSCSWWTDVDTPVYLLPFSIKSHIYQCYSSGMSMHSL